MISEPGTRALAKSSRQLPPGPTEDQLISRLLGRQPDSLRMILDGWRTYGDTVRFRIGGRSLVLIAQPDDVKHVLVDNNRNYVKGRALQKAKPLLGEGLLTSEGDFWRRQRRMAQPAFHQERVRALATTMVSATETLLHDLRSPAESGAPFNVAPHLMRLTLRIVGLALFGVDLGAEASRVYQALTFTIHHINQITQRPDVLSLLPNPANRAFTEAVSTLNRVVYDMIQRRRSGREHPGDLLDLLLGATDPETDERMSDRQLRDEVMTLFLAGHETTANGLAWLTILLSQHPSVARRLRADIRDVLGNGRPTVEDLQRLPYLRMVVDEGLRLYPPAWTVARIALNDDRLGGYWIPAGTGILASQYLTHRHPAYWDNPEGFDPDRFSEEASGDRPRFAYFPFGGGPRQCIGNSFAHLELQIILAMMVQEYDLQLLPGQRLEMEPLVTLRPKYGVWARARAVRAVA